MSIICLVAAMDKNRGIGYNNQLLCHLPADLHHFKKITLGKPIVMGRKTFESIGKALPERRNIVISNTLHNTPEVDVFPSLDEALKDTEKDDEVMIIGGAGIFQQALLKANRLYLTYIHHRFNADVYFPEFNEKEWSVEQSVYRPKDEKNPFDLTFVQLERNS